MSDRRDKTKFLLQMHEAYWNNISRAEDACWKMIAAYTALIAGLSISISVIGFAGFLAVFIPFSFLSVIISLNANLWFVRNIGLISNLEKEFLEKGDYNSLIPRDFGDKYPFINSEPWWIFVFVYFSVCSIVTGIMFQKLNCTEQVLIACLFSFGVLFTIWYGAAMHARYEKFKKEAPGKSPN